MNLDRDKRKTNRCLLAGFLAFISGCSGTDVSSESTESTDVPSVTRYGSQSTENADLTAGTTTEETTFNFSFFSFIVHKEGVPDQLHLELQNQSDTKIEVEFGPGQPLSNTVGKNSNGDRLVLMPSEDIGMQGEVAKQKDCWTLKGEPSKYSIAERIALSPGESVRDKYDILNHQANEACFPSGEYLFIEELKTRSGEELRLDLVIQVKEHRARESRTSINVV